MYVTTDTSLNFGTNHLLGKQSITQYHSFLKVGDHTRYSKSCLLAFRFLHNRDEKDCY